MSDAYPQPASENEMAGVTTARLAVDLYGEVSACPIVRPSRFKALDRRVCDALSTRARLYPAMDDDQNPVASEPTQVVKWVIPSDE